VIMRQLILATATIRSTSTADITPVDGIIIKLTRVEGDDGLSRATSVFLKSVERGNAPHQKGQLTKH
jgi:hypothetical protein